MNTAKVLSTIILLASANLFCQTTPTQIKGVTFKKSREADTAQVRINSTFLLLGTLNDYISHQYVTRQNQVDRYYDYEKPLMKYVDSIAREDFKITLSEDKNCLLSEELSNKMNAHYIGNILNEDLFDSNEKKLSFLLGVYLRDGEKIDENVCKIQLANAPKHHNVYSILKELDCRNIFFKRLDNYPRIYKIYFEPTPIMKKYFATVAAEKEKLLDAKFESLRHIKRSKEAYQKERLKENLAIIQLFGKQ